MCDKNLWLITRLTVKGANITQPSIFQNVWFLTSHPHYYNPLLRTCLILKHFRFWQMVFDVFFMLHSVNLETREVTVIYLLSKNVWPLSPDKVPCQRLSNHVVCNVDNGGCGILFPDQGWIQRVLQIPKKQISKQHVCKSVTVNDVLSNEVQ